MVVHPILNIIVVVAASLNELVCMIENGIGIILRNEKAEKEDEED